MAGLNFKVFPVHFCDLFLFVREGKGRGGKGREGGGGRGVVIN